MAKKQINKTYAIFLPAALIIAAVIFFYPTKPAIKSQYYQQNPIALVNTTNVGTVENIANNPEQVEPGKDGAESKVEIKISKQPQEIERRIKRDIFSLENAEVSEPVKTSEEPSRVDKPVRVKQRRDRPSLDIRGIMIADNEIKSIILGNGRILKEKEKIEGYIIKKIERAKVTLVSEDDKDTITVKVWEE